MGSWIVVFFLDSFCTPTPLSPLPLWVSRWGPPPAPRPKMKHGMKIFLTFFCFSLKAALVFVVRPTVGYLCLRVAAASLAPTLVSASEGLCSCLVFRRPSAPLPPAQCPALSRAEDAAKRRFFNPCPYYVMVGSALLLARIEMSTGARS